MDELGERRARLVKSLGGIIEPDLLEYHECVDSTQLRAHELARGGAKAALVAAEMQTSARGRLSRRWESPKGSGLCFSVMYRFDLRPATAHLVNAAAAIATAEAVKDALGVELRLKWPNDLLIGKKVGGKDGGGDFKVCGILSESAVRGGVIDYCVTGIGLNLYEPDGLPPDVAERSGWLAWESANIDGAGLLIRIVENLWRWLGVMEKDGAARVLEAYRGRCSSIGRAVRVETGTETLHGICSGIGGEGELILDTPEGQRRFHAADVTHAKLV